MTIPAGTQPDTVLRLRGKGLPEFGGRQRGDLYIVVRAEVPGLNKEDLEVSVSDHAVILRGELTREEETGEYYSREMGSGAFSRTIGLPAAVDAQQVKVRLKNGILEMTMPKTEADKRHKIAIEES